MPNNTEFSSKIPTEDEIEEGRKSSLLVGLIIGGVVVAVGIIAYLIFGKYLVV